MLVVYNNYKTLYVDRGTLVEPLDYSGDVVIAMDPSKTNFAMLIGTPEEEIIEIVEFSGNNRGRGPTEDTTLYCAELKHFLKQYLRNVKLYVVGIEAVITVKGKTPDKVSHISNIVLNEIRSAVLSFFLEEYGITPTQVNNWSWKHHELPEGYRHPYEKYSKKYLMDTDPTNPLCAYFNEDATDAYFIYKYLVHTMCTTYTVYCNQVESKLHEYSIAITEVGSIYASDLREVLYNNLFSIEENATFYANRIKDGCYFKAPIDAIPIEMIYKCAQCMSDEIIDSQEAWVVVQ